jgi:transcriptional regulator with XRE-family HTH domain
MDTGSGIDSFGARLRRHRDGRLSQRALAVRAGTSQSYLSRVESGAVTPTLDQAERLANCLGYRLRVDFEPLPQRSDPAALADQLAMSVEERLASAAALHGAVAELRAGAE